MRVNYTFTTIIKYLMVLASIGVLSVMLFAKIVSAQQPSTPSAQTSPSPSTSPSPTPTATPTPSAGPSPLLVSATTTNIYDANGDGILDLIDARIISPPATTNCPVCVDVNGDGIIDQNDINLVSYYAGLSQNKPSVLPSYNPRLDVNNDGQLTADDVNIIRNYLGKSIVKPAFGLDNPSELTFGFMAKELLIKYKTSISDVSKQSISSKYSLSQKQSLQGLNTERMLTQNDNVESVQKQIATEPIVEKVFKNHVGEASTNDPFWAYQWALPAMRMEQTWFAETPGNSNRPVRVAVIDTGLDLSHPDLQKNISSLRRNGFTFWPDPDWDNVADTGAHGTYMAGIIGATTNNGVGIAGTAPNVEIVPIKAGYGIPYGCCHIFPKIVDSAVAVGFYWALGQDVKVINMSFNLGYVDDNDYLSNYLLDTARNDFHINLIAAAGNDGRNSSSYPAHNNNVVSVAATAPDGSLTDFTSGRTGADIRAPGESIVGPIPTDIFPERGGYIVGDGTSAAAAYVSGIVALCRTVQPIDGENTDLTCQRQETLGGSGIIDAWATLWYRNCYHWDFINDNIIDGLDAQALAFNYGSANPRYDISPVGGDGIINDSDVWVFYRGYGLSCQPR